MRTDSQHSNRPDTRVYWDDKRRSYCFVHEWKNRCGRFAHVHAQLSSSDVDEINSEVEEALSRWEGAKQRCACNFSWEQSGHLWPCPMFSREGAEIAMDRFGDYIKRNYRIVED